MVRLIRELRRREVFRTLGLYVGSCWLLIEAASVLGPAFGGPDWLVRVVVVVAIVGLPIAAALAWIYDLTKRGIAHDRGDADEAVAPFGRGMDFAVIGLLSVALTVSVYLNITNLRGSSAAAAPDPISVLIADFANETGDEIFSGLLEQALTIGIESAPHVMTLDREAAAATAAELRSESGGLLDDAARLVAVREGIELVLVGSIASSGNGFTLHVSGIDPVNGEPDFELSRNASDRDAVLATVGRLSEDIREALGDTTLDGGTATQEAFTASSIEAAGAYVEATRLAFEGRHADAMVWFREATELDPNLGRAFAGWAVSAFKVGQLRLAEDLWSRALSRMYTMTERERLRTLGVYYGTISQNYDRAVETFAELVSRYPADAAAHNNLAVTSFLALDFETAAEEGRRVVEMFPQSLLYRSNLALYAMYSGEFGAAAAQARAAIETDATYGTAYLPLAIALMAEGDFAAARETYRQMARATASEHGASLAALGLADISIFLGEFDEAREALATGIERDLERSEPVAAATKEIALSQTFLQTGDISSALASARSALEHSATDAIRTAAGLVMVESGEVASAAELADALSMRLNSQSQAYGLMLEAAILQQSGRHVEAIDLLERALDRADLWLVRYERARAYLEAGYFVEAFDDYMTCLARRGEATALYLDDTPTFRVMAELPYWLGRAQDGLGMQREADENFRAFLNLRPDGSLAEDARSRMR